MKGKRGGRRSWQRGIRFCLTVATLVLSPSGVTAAQSPPATGTLVVTLSGMKEDRGQLVYAMWSGPEGWLETNAVREGSAPIIEGSSRLRFEGLPHGEYAISAYHDRNGNGKLDTGLFGIPKEPLGTSNDAKIRFGPPKYEDAAFILDQAELTIHIPVKKIF